MPTDELKKECRYCKEPVHVDARKCHHCGEFLEKRSRIERTVKRVIGYVGIATAILSVFYGLREGYYFIKEHSEKRQALEAYMFAAKNFQKQDNLEYADDALKKALAMKPNDLDLRLRYFTNRSHRLAREMEYNPIVPKEIEEAIPPLIPEGYALLNQRLKKIDRAAVLVMLGRLITLDRTWSGNKNEETLSLFTEAYRIAPTNSEVVFRYGYRLLMEGEEKKGMELLHQAVEIDPENAFYLEQMGEYFLKVKKYREAILPLTKAINLREQQKEAQRIWASNKAKQHLRKLLIRADNEHDITSADFLGLDIDERESIVEFALKHNENHRDLHHVAAKFYYANGNFKKADRAMRKSLGDYKSYVSRSNIPKLEFFAKILKDGGHDPQALAEVQAILREKRQR